MPQRDLVAELRAARVAAPPQVRDRVRLIAAGAPPERRRRTWRLALAVVVPVAAAVAATVVFTRPAHHAAPVALHGESAQSSAGRAFAPSLKSLPVPTSPKRVQSVGASVTLRVTSLSDAVKRAVAVATSLSGYAASVHAQTNGARGTADLTLKVPRANVQKAIARLSALGTITAENVDLTDRTAGLNADARTIARLRAQLAAATDPKQRAAIVARIQAIQRKDAATRRAAHYATVRVHLATPPAPVHHGHDWWKLAWAAGGAAVLALLLLAGRAVRRLREERLLSRS